MVFRQFYAFFDAMAYGFMMYHNERVNNEDNTTDTDELSLDFTDLSDWNKNTNISKLYLVIYCIIKYYKYS